MPEFPASSVESGTGLYVEAIVTESEALDPVGDTQGVLEDDGFPGTMSMEGGKLTYKGTLERHEHLARLQSLMEEVHLRFTFVKIIEQPLETRRAA